MTTLPAPSAPSATPDRYFFGGNPATGQVATVVEDEWLNMVQEELINAILAGGLTPSKAERDQLARAIAAIAGGASSGAYLPLAGGAMSPGAVVSWPGGTGGAGANTYRITSTPGGWFGISNPTQELGAWFRYPPGNDLSDAEASFDGSLDVGGPLGALGIHIALPWYGDAAAGQIISVGSYSCVSPVLMALAFNAYATPGAGPGGVNWKYANNGATGAMVAAGNGFAWYYHTGQPQGTLFNWTNQLMEISSTGDLTVQRHLHASGALTINQTGHIEGPLTTNNYTDQGGMGTRYPGVGGAGFFAFHWYAGMPYVYVDGAQQGYFAITASDASVKSRLEPPEVDALADILALPLKSFDRQINARQPKHHYPIGLIAQDVEKIAPDAVCEAPRDKDHPDEMLKSIRPEQLLMRCIGGIQQLTTQLSIARERIETLERRS